MKPWKRELRKHPNTSFSQTTSDRLRQPLWQIGFSSLNSLLSTPRLLLLLCGKAKAIIDAQISASFLGLISLYFEFVPFFVLRIPKAAFPDSSEKQQKREFNHSS